MASEYVEVLKSSDDPEELVLAAVKLARDDGSGAHQELRRALTSAVFLEKLDSPEEYDGPSDNLRVRAVLEGLAENRAAAARESIVGLTQSRSFLQRIARIELLIDATAAVRPASEEIIKFWSAHDSPDDAYVYRIMRAALDNRSEPALEYFEARLADERYEPAKKVEWLRKLYLPQRANADVLSSCERMLRSDMPDELKLHVIDATFDFDSKWYMPNDKVVCPRIEMYAGRARVRLHKVAEYCLHDMELPDRQRGLIEATLEQLHGPRRDGESW